MPTITGSRQGGSTGPYLTLQWDVLQTDVANNRSRVRLILYLNASHRINFSASKSGSLQGSSFSYTRGANGTGSWELRRQEVWVGHNSDGSKTQNFSGSFNIAISYSGTYISSLSVSGNVSLPVIPRASTLSAFSFGAQLKNGVANSINYTVDRKSGNFRHSIQLRDGNTTIWTWDNQNTDGTNSIALTASDVNTLLNRMSTVTSKTFTLRVATRSGVGGGWIGSAVSRTATATVHADVKPSVGTLTLSQTGNSVSTHYLQGISKITSSFTRSAGYGASISSSSITVRRKGNNDDVQTINSNSGTTSRTIAHSGTYQAQGMARDSRGRTTYTAWTDFSVTAYDSPRITNFTANRSSSTPTTVSISRAGTHTPLGGSNVLTYTVQRRVGTGSWTNVNTNATGTSTASSFSGTSTSTGNAVTSSYDFRMVVTDKFGESAESVITVSTQRVVLDIHKNEGVGIGKIHENGVLDVDGAIYSNGARLDRAQLFDETGYSGMDTSSEWGKISQGVYYVRPRNIENQPTGYGFMDVMGIDFADEYNIIWYEQTTGRMYRKSGYGQGGVNSDWTLIDAPESGTTSTGNWLRFNDGTQICYANIITSSHTMTSWGSSGMYYSDITLNRAFPKAFSSQPTVTATVYNSPGAYVGMLSRDATKLQVLSLVRPAATTSSFSVSYIAIGRWY